MTSYDFMDISLPLCCGRGQRAGPKRCNGEKMKLIQVMFGVLFACAAAGKAAGAPQAPASEGKSTPAVATTPKEALKRMMLAGLTTDPKVVRPLFWTANELESESADVWVASTTGQDRLREAVRARCGDDGV